MARRRETGVDRLPSGLYRARITVGGQRLTRADFRTAQQASEWRAARRTGVVEPVQPVGLGAAQTVLSAVEARGAGRRNWLTTASRLRRDPLGRTRLAEVRTSDLDAWVERMKGSGLAASTIRLEATMIRATFSRAVEDGVLPSSPWTRTVSQHLPDLVDHRADVLTVEQVQALIDAVPARFATLVAVQAQCGLRISEAIAVRASDVDLKARTLRVARQRDRSGRADVPLKVRPSGRTVPLSPSMVATLADHVMRYGARDDALLFTTDRGRPLNASRYRAAIFTPACRVAGLPEGTTPHALRHHCGSIMVASGVPPATAAKILGNSLAVLLSTYSHALPSGDDLVRRIFESAWTASEPRLVTQRS